MMSRHKHIKSCAQLILLVAVALHLSLAVHAQGKLPQERAESETQESKQSLEIELRSLTPVACLGSSVMLEVEITNKGKEEVILNKAYFWNSYWFHPLTPQEQDQERKFFINHFWPRSSSEDIFHVAPGMTLVDARDWPLSDIQTGLYIYEARIYGQKKEVQIQIYECGLQTIKEQ